MQNDPNLAALKGEMATAAKEQRGHALFVYIDSERDKRSVIAGNPANGLILCSVMEFFGLGPRDVPSVRIVKEGKDMNIQTLEGTITAASISELIASFTTPKPVSQVRKTKIMMELNVKCAFAARDAASTARPARRVHRDAS